jgi:hypothetical protein
LSQDSNLSRIRVPSNFIVPMGLSRIAVGAVTVLLSIDKINFVKTVHNYVLRVSNGGHNRITGTQIVIN